MKGTNPFYPAAGQIPPTIPQLSVAKRFYSKKARSQIVSRMNFHVHVQNQEDGPGNREEVQGKLRAVNIFQGVDMHKLPDAKNCNRKEKRNSRVYRYKHADENDSDHDNGRQDSLLHFNTSSVYVIKVGNGGVIDASASGKGARFLRSAKNF